MFDGNPQSKFGSAEYIARFQIHVCSGWGFIILRLRRLREAGRRIHPNWGRRLAYLDLARAPGFGKVTSASVGQIF